MKWRYTSKPSNQSRPKATAPLGYNSLLIQLCVVMLVKLLCVVEIVMHTVHAVVCSDIYHTFLYHQPLYDS